MLRLSAYALVRNAAGELAVVRTGRGCFLPGGGIEADESPEQAVAREVREECGLVVNPCAFLGRAVEIVFSAEGNTCFQKESVFAEADLSGLVTSTEPDHQLVWLSLNQAVEALSYESHRWAVRRLSRRDAPERPPDAGK